MKQYIAISAIGADRVRALLPVLPLFVVEHGIDVPTLGLIAAAWSIGKLVAEPVFGYLADRTSRKPFLIGGAVVLAIVTVLPVWFNTALELFVLRLIAGVATGAYDPAARGLIDWRRGRRSKIFPPLLLMTASTRPSHST